MIKWPEHKAGMTLHHNYYKTYYKTAKDAIEWMDEIGSGDAWISEEQKQRALETGEIWELQWYPRTPVGFHQIAASSFEALMQYLEQEETA